MWGWALNHFKRKTENLSNANAKRFQMDRRATDGLLIQKNCIFYISYVVFFSFFFFVSLSFFAFFLVFFFGDSIQNSEYSFFSVLPLARLTVNFFEHEKHIRTLMGPPLCTPFNRYVTTLATYSLHIPPLPDANIKN